MEIAVQAELDREMPGYPKITAIRLFRQSTRSAKDPSVLCDRTVDLPVAIVEAPGRADMAVTVYYDATASLVAVPWEPPC